MELRAGESIAAENQETLLVMQDDGKMDGRQGNISY
jgi:hypothetical protein